MQKAIFVISALSWLCAVVQAVCPATGESFTISTVVNGVTYFLQAYTGAPPSLTLDATNATSLYFTANGTATTVDNSADLVAAEDASLNLELPLYLYNPYNSGYSFPLLFTCSADVLSATVLGLEPPYNDVAGARRSAVSSFVVCRDYVTSALQLHVTKPVDNGFGFAAAPNFSNCITVTPTAVPRASYSSGSQTTAPESVATNSNTAGAPIATAPLYPIPISNVTTTTTSVQPTPVPSSPVIINAFSTYVVQSYVTVLSQALTFTEKQVVYSGSAGQSLTVTNCPCIRTAYDSAPQPTTVSPQVVYVYQNQCPQVNVGAVLQAPAQVVSICSICPPVSITSASQSGSLLYVSTATSYYTLPTAGTYYAGTTVIEVTQAAVATLTQALTTTYKFVEQQNSYLEIDVFEEIYQDYTVSTLTNKQTSTFSSTIQGTGTVVVVPTKAVSPLPAQISTSLFTTTRGATLAITSRANSSAVTTAIALTTAITLTTAIPAETARAHTTAVSPTPTKSIVTSMTHATSGRYLNSSITESPTMTLSASPSATACTTYLFVPQVSKYLVVDPAGHLATDDINTNYTSVYVDDTGRLINSTGGAYFFIDPTLEDDYQYPYTQTGYGLLYESGASDPDYLANGEPTPPHEPDANGRSTVFSVDSTGSLQFTANGSPYQFQFCPDSTANASKSGASGNHISLFSTLLDGCQAYDVKLNVTCP